MTAVFLLNCVSEIDDNEELPHIPDLEIDSSYLELIGGDPRGCYQPNTPFVYYYGDLPDSLNNNTAEGNFVISGVTADSGEFELNLTISVSGRIGTYIYAYVPFECEISGSWYVDNIYFIAKHGDLTDTVTFTADEQGLYFIEEIFKNRPPIVDRDIEPNPHGPCIWIYKK